MQNLLTFVAVRLFLPRGSARLPRAVANALYQIIAMVAQQFEGYIFSVNVQEVGPCPFVSPSLKFRVDRICFRPENVGY